MFRLLRTCSWMCIITLAAGAGQALAQGGACRDPWINQAYNQIFHRAPQGSGDAGDCNINLYGGGSWSSYQDLYNKVLGSKDCQDPWIGEAYILALHRHASGGECSAVSYGGGHWANFPDLVNKVQQYQSQVGRPAPVPQPAPAPAAPAINVSSCNDRWITQAISQIYHRAPQGSGTTGECNINLYGGGSWSSYQDLYNKVLASKDCQDPWIGEAWMVAVNRHASGNECSAVNYGGGHWANFPDLVNKVRQYQAQSIARTTYSAPPAPSVQAPGRRTVANPSVTLVSQMGAKCLDAEGGRVAGGNHLIGYPCNGNYNEQFIFQANGSLTLGGFCVDAGPAGRDGDQLFLWNCTGAASQRWRLSGGQLVSSTGKCIDLKGGTGWWWGNQPAIIYTCNGQMNQRWIEGVVVPGNRIRGIVPTQPGALTQLSPVNATAGVIATGGANVVNAGGANLINGGAGNLISGAGGNLISGAGGNLISGAGGNLINGAGGNLINGSAGNVIVLVQP